MGTTAIYSRGSHEQQPIQRPMLLICQSHRPQHAPHLQTSFQVCSPGLPRLHRLPLTDLRPGAIPHSRMMSPPSATSRRYALIRVHPRSDLLGPPFTRRRPVPLTRRIAEAQAFASASAEVSVHSCASALRKPASPSRPIFAPASSRRRVFGFRLGRRWSNSVWQVPAHSAREHLLPRSFANRRTKGNGHGYSGGEGAKDQARNGASLIFVHCTEISAGRAISILVSYFYLFWMHWLLDTVPAKPS